MRSSGEKPVEPQDIRPESGSASPRASNENDGAWSSAARFFDAIAGRYDRAYALDVTESRRRMVPVLGVLPPPPARVIDLWRGHRARAAVPPR